MKEVVLIIVKERFLAEVLTEVVKTAEVEVFDHDGTVDLEYQFSDLNPTIVITDDKDKVNGMNNVDVSSIEFISVEKPFSPSEFKSIFLAKLKERQNILN